MFAGPPLSDGQSPVNTELIHIANQSPQPFPAFKDTDGRPIDAASAQAVQKFLGGPDVTGLCSATATVCEIRKSYYQNYRADWPSIQDDLTNAKEKCATPHAGFTMAECDGIRAQLRDEVSMVAKVTALFRPGGSPASRSGPPAWTHSPTSPKSPRRSRTRCSRPPRTTRPRTSSLGFAYLFKPLGLRRPGPPLSPPRWPPRSPRLLTSRGTTVRPIRSAPRSPPRPASSASSSRITTHRRATTSTTSAG